MRRRTTTFTVAQHELIFLFFDFESRSQQRLVDNNDCCILHTGARIAPSQFAFYWLASPPLHFTSKVPVLRLECRPLHRLQSNTQTGGRKVSFEGLFPLFKHKLIISSKTLYISESRLHLVIYIIHKPFRCFTVVKYKRDA
jgi:hypothetical protein